MSSCRFACIAQDLMDCRLPKSKTEKSSTKRRSSCGEGARCTVCLCADHSAPSKSKDTCIETSDKRTSRGKDTKNKISVYGNKEGRLEEARSSGIATRHLVNKRKIKIEEAPSPLPTVRNQERKDEDEVKDYDNERKQATSEEQESNNFAKASEVAKLKSEVYDLKSALTGLKIWLRNIPDSGEERDKKKKDGKREGSEEDVNEPQGDLAMEEEEKEEEDVRKKKTQKVPNIENRVLVKGHPERASQPTSAKVTAKNRKEDGMSATRALGRQFKEEDRVAWTGLADRMAATTVKIAAQNGDEDTKNFAFQGKEEDAKSQDVQNRMLPAQDRQALGTTLKLNQRQTKKVSRGKQGMTRKEHGGKKDTAKWRIEGKKTTAKVQQGLMGSAKDRVKSGRKGKQGQKTTTGAKKAMGQQHKQSQGGGTTVAGRMPLAPKVEPKNANELTDRMVATTTAVNEVNYLDLEEFSDFQADIKEKMSDPQLNPRMAKSMQGKFDSFLNTFKQLKMFQNQMKSVSGA